MRLRRALQRLFHTVRAATPGPIRTVGAALGLKRATAWLNPIEDPDYTWTLGAPRMEGMRIRIGTARNYHIVAQPYEAEVCGAIAGIVRPGFVCADVGAHIGYMTLLMAALVGPSGRVVAFEPDPENADLVARNAALNDLSARVVVETAAVSAGDARTLAFYRGASSSEGSTRSRGGTAVVRVRAISLDQYFAEQRGPDFVKIDVEGAEGDVVTGMQRLLASARPVMLLEVHGHEGWPALEALRMAHYRLYELSGAEYAIPVPPTGIIHVVARPA